MRKDRAERSRPPDNETGSALPNAEELIERGELDPNDYRLMLLATLFDLDMDYVPELLRENQANGKPIPREAYTAYIEAFGDRGIRRLANTADLETSYIPELAMEIGVEMNGLDADELLNKLVDRYEDIKFDPRFQRAVAQYGGGFSQFKLFDKRNEDVVVKGIDPGAVDALMARGSEYAPHASPETESRLQAKSNYGHAVTKIREEHWSRLKQARQTRNEAIRSADDESAGNTTGESHKPSESELVAEEKKWQAIFAHLKEIDQANTAQEQAVNGLVA